MHSVTKVKEIIEIGMTDALLAYLMIIEESDEPAHVEMRATITRFHALSRILGGRNA